jgi:hypothetical protein
MPVRALPVAEFCSQCHRLTVLTWTLVLDACLDAYWLGYSDAKFDQKIAGYILIPTHLHGLVRRVLTIHEGLSRS